MIDKMGGKPRILAVMDGNNYNAFFGQGCGLARNLPDFEIEPYDADRGSSAEDSLRLQLQTQGDQFIALITTTYPGYTGLRAPMLQYFSGPKLMLQCVGYPESVDGFTMVYEPLVDNLPKVVRKVLE